MPYACVPKPISKRKVQGALEDYNQAINLDPKAAKTYVGRGLAHAGKGDREGMIADFRKALEIDPTNEAVKNTLKNTLAGLDASKDCEGNELDKKIEGCSAIIDAGKQ